MSARKHPRWATCWHRFTCVACLTLPLGYLTNRGAFGIIWVVDDASGSSVVRPSLCIRLEARCTDCCVDFCDRNVMVVLLEPALIQSNRKTPRATRTENRPILATNE